MQGNDTRAATSGVRIGAYLFEYKSNIYLFGGQRVAPTPTDPYALGEPFNDVWLIPNNNGVSFKWLSGGAQPDNNGIIGVTLPSPRISPACTNSLNRGFLFVYGGYYSNQNTGIYDINRLLFVY